MAVSSKKGENITASKYQSCLSIFKRRFRFLALKKKLKFIGHHILTESTLGVDMSTVVLLYFLTMLNVSKWWITL